MQFNLLNSVIVYLTVMYCTVLLYYTVLHFTALYYTVLYYTIPSPHPNWSQPVPPSPHYCIVPNSPGSPPVCSAAPSPCPSPPPPPSSLHSSLLAVPHPLSGSTPCHKTIPPACYIMTADSAMRLFESEIEGRSDSSCPCIVSSTSDTQRCAPVCAISLLAGGVRLWAAVRGN